MARVVKMFERSVRADFLFLQERARPHGGLWVHARLPQVMQAKNATLHAKVLALFGLSAHILSRAATIATKGRTSLISSIKNFSCDRQKSTRN